MAYLLPDPVAPDLIPSIPNFFPEEKIVDDAEVNQQRCLNKSVLWVANVDQTHQVLASGKLVLIHIFFLRVGSLGST